MKFREIIFVQLLKQTDSALKFIIAAFKYKCGQTTERYTKNLAHNYVDGS